MRTFLAVFVALSFSTAAFAADPAKKADPAPAKAEPAKAAPTAAADCDMCKANMAYMKAGKVQVYKLDNGMVTIVTTDAKGQAGLDKAAKDMEEEMKVAMDGKAKLDDNCSKMLENVKAGKVFMGHGKIKDGYASATMSNDPDIAKGILEMADKMGPPAKPAKK
jgi:hypothetical protein